MLGMRQEELADLAGASRRTVALFEAGTRTPRAATMERLRLALEQSGVDFIDTGAGEGVIVRREGGEA